MFNEVQKFRQPWLWIILALSAGIVLYRWQPISIGVLVGVLSLFWFLALETKIDKEGISYRWLPFQLRYKVIKWSQIEQVTVREYAAITEYGGWGIRFGWPGMAHTMSGRYGIEIKRAGKKRTLLIGTQKPDETRQILETVSPNVILSTLV